MNKSLLVGGMAALALAAAAGVAIAQQSPARPAHGARADVDGDGRVSQAEFVGRRVQRLTAADANSDGSVAPDEMRAARRAHMAARADAGFDRMDADDDGAISRAEFDARREARAHHGPRRAGRGAARGGHMETRGPVVIAEAQSRAEQAFARLDADNDGFVTAAERQAGRQAMREHHRERMAQRRAQRQASPQAPASE
ncbi:EF-hand domain-containing protein [Brevundimonas sp.]|uniref:EF-hand domain-containing protein n=1 Tax=Brevundimonas sp. TaxID=1871086 RepID=UPI002737B7CE|nr:EF-hand domain-containing protein [Brevundimonas sp.]MDP3803161.1 EF-hand domain-containing protein [Brevundimonas sp.]